MNTRQRLLAGIAAFFALTSPALAIDDGDTVRIIVPYSPGGGYDAQARLVAPKLAEELNARGLPNVSVIVENVQGSGGAIGTAAVYAEEPDGTTILMMDPESSIYHEMLSNAPFEVDQFTYLAQQSADELVFAIRQDLGIKSFDAMVERSQETPILMGASGGTGYGLVFPVMMRKMLVDAGTQLEFDYVPMSGTSEVVASMRRGEVEGTVRSHVAMQQAAADGVVDILFTFSDDPNNTMCTDDSGAETACMTAREALGLADEDFDLLSSAARYRRVYAGPPGMDEETTTLLREAFDAIFTDADFIEASAASNNPVTYISGADVFGEIEMELRLAERFNDYLREEIQ